MSEYEIGAITMPKWGMTMEDGELMDWIVTEGSDVSVGEAVANVETDKITGVVESPVGGRVRRHVAQPGDVLAVGALLAVVCADDVPDADVDAYINSFSPSS